MPPSNLLDQAEEIRSEIDRLEPKAAKAWENFTTLRDSAVAEGIDLVKDAEAFDKLDEAGKAHDSIKDEIAELETRYSRVLQLAGKDAPESTSSRGRGRDGTSVRDVAERLSLGAALTDSDEYKAAVASGIFDSATKKLGEVLAIEASTRTELRNALLTGEGASANVPYGEDRLAELVGFPRAALSVLNLITIGETDEKTVEWIEDTGFDEDGALEVSEGNTKAEQTAEFTLRESTVRTLAAWIPATRQSLSDAGWLRTEIDSQLAYKVRRRTHKQVLNGTGAAPNLRGIYNTANIGSQPQGSDSLVDAIHKGITVVRVNYFDEPTAVGIHPNDWESIRLQRDDSGASAGTGGYLFGPPSMSGAPTIWGMMPLVHVDFPEGNPLVGAFREAVLWVREGLTIRVSDSHDDYFVKNLVAILAEYRAAFGVRQPRAFCEVPEGT